MAAAAQLAFEIRKLRKAAGLSHAQLASEIGYARQHVSMAERPVEAFRLSRWCEHSTRLWAPTAASPNSGTRRRPTTKLSAHRPV
ncbi:helix-turn-helix domain-containing protein [Kibdelosporangium banguiense]|uniref:helix-turn-helix domain-containing protein n=1 Tax=Kibdelosporangium banguiense TaxID=1365924 RepID=UPI001AEB218F